MLPQHCFCDRLHPIAAATRVVVVMHVKELPKVSNTARLLPMALTDGRLVLHGCPGPPTQVDGLADPARQTYVLFPGAGARPLSRAELAADGRPVTLVVPDGTWRQAQRIVRRVPAVVPLPRRCLPEGPPSRYRLRSAAPGRLSTCEAVGRALGLLEGPAVEAELMALFDALVEGALAARAGV
jgi:DTW domain-containing protein YfiP